MFRPLSLWEVFQEMRFVHGFWNFNCLWAPWGRMLVMGIGPPYGSNCTSGAVRVHRLCLLEDVPCIALCLMRKKHSKIVFK